MNCFDEEIETCQIFPTEQVSKLLARYGLDHLAADPAQLGTNLDQREIGFVNKLFLYLFSANNRLTLGQKRDMLREAS